MKRVKDSEVAMVCVYHTDENGPVMRNAWGLHEAVTIGSVKKGTFVIAEIIDGHTDSKKANALARLLIKLNAMTAAEIEESLLG